MMNRCFKVLCSGLGLAVTVIGTQPGCHRHSRPVRPRVESRYSACADMMSVVCSSSCNFISGSNLLNT